MCITEVTPGALRGAWLYDVSIYFHPHITNLSNTLINLTKEKECPVFNVKNQTLTKTLSRCWSKKKYRLRKRQSFKKSKFWPTILVQGSRRKIKLFFLVGTIHQMTDQDIVWVTHVADKMGWKHVVLDRDDCMGETIEMMNLDQHRNNYHHGLRGIYVCSPQSWEVPY